VITLPFENTTPLRTIYVSPTGRNTGSGSVSDPLKTIQAAVDLATPGTTIMVKAGTYTGTVKFTASGLPDAPISLVSADGPGAAKIVPGSSTASAIISAFGEENIVISGFDVSGGGRLANGIHFGMSGSDFADLTANIVIKDNIVHDTVKDSIKVSQGDYIYVVDNTVSRAGDQGIDFVAVNNSVIARNHVSDISGTVALFAKGGSTNVLIAQNHVANVRVDGIAVGGWTDVEYMRPGFTGWQAKNVTVIDNYVEGVGKRPLNIFGAQDSQIVHNFLESNPDYYYIVTIQPDNLTPPRSCSNLLLKDNVFDRSEHWLQLLPGQNTGLQLVDNRFDGVYQGEKGPHGGPLDYDLAWLPDNDYVVGTAGSDRLDGGTGADTLAGGAGSDTYIVDNSKDVVQENSRSGTDTVISSVSFALAANVERLTLVQGAGSIDGTGNDRGNRLTGNEADNVLDGGGGVDSMAGGKGNDTYYVDNIKDTAMETLSASSGGGIDRVYSSISFTLGANLENLVLTSGAKNGTGNSLHNDIVGNAEANTIVGNGGHDTIDGGGGSDTVTGGAGNDRMVVSSGNDVVRYTNELDGHDVIVGFDGNSSGGQDVLGLDALFDSLDVATADRAARVSLAPGSGTVGVQVDVSAQGDGGDVIAVATIHTIDAITVGQDVLVGSA
jgi:hypothetical protein